MEEKSLQLVLIPWPVMGHVQIVDFAKLIIHRTNHDLPPGTNLSVTVLLMKLPDYIDTVSSSFADSLCASPSTPRLHFHHLPPTDPTPEWSSRTRGYFIHNLVLSQRSNVADFLRLRCRNTAAVVADMLCTSMIDVAEDLGLPSYIFFTSPASFLGAMLHCQTLHDDQSLDVPELRNSVSDLTIPSFAKPVPANVLSLVLVDRQSWLDRFLHYARGYRKARGIIVNTFAELEPHALASLSRAGSVPAVYPVGPILNQGPPLPSDVDSRHEVLRWLDGQPNCSVVFVCFGSQGSLPVGQVRELAMGLERSGIRFLWSLRRGSGEGAGFPTEYDDYGGVLLEGFLERTAVSGRVVGWAPQLEVLAHVAVGGFVSHCGWNSVLESVWCGVPIATWPLHSEQQMNAFQLARELGLAVEITLSYNERGGDGAVVGAGEIERGVREVMEGGSEVRRRLRVMREKASMSVVEGGSSYASFKRFIDDVMNNVSR